MGFNEKLKSHYNDVVHTIRVVMTQNGGMVSMQQNYYRVHDRIAPHRIVVLWGAG